MIQPFSDMAADRNKAPIFSHLAPLLGDQATVLEIGAGQGVHARYITELLPGISWQASEHPRNLVRLQAGLAGCKALPQPLVLDVAADWPAGPFTAVYAANVSHIMAWPEVVRLFAGSAEVLSPAGLLCLYGPFFDDERVTAESNIEFDVRLRERAPTMGLRRVQALDELAAEQGLARSHDWSLPANNRLLVWEKG